SVPTPCLPKNTTSCGSDLIAAASTLAMPSESASAVSPLMCNAFVAPRARHSRSACCTRSGPKLITVTSPPLFSLRRIASSSANSSYGETMNLIPASSMRRESPAIFIRDSVSGTWAMQTTEFNSGPPAARRGPFYTRHALRKHGIQYTQISVNVTRTEERNAILESPLWGRRKRSRSQILPAGPERLQQTARAKKRTRDQSRSSRVDQRGELLLRQADELQDADGHRHDRRRG